MPNSASAKKRVRQNATRRARNRWRLGQVRGAIKEFRASLVAGDTAKAGDQLKAIYKLLDQVATTKTIHKNTASRYKSRLTARLNTAKAKPAAAGA
jgi:small subunit ribosomal protein S20